SSRRRHTRFSRDWSSDVCSSDLEWTATGQPATGAVISQRNPVNENPASFVLGRRGFVWRRVVVVSYCDTPLGAAGGVFCLKISRSEERRVGKECRSRWWSGDVRK